LCCPVPPGRLGCPGCQVCPGFPGCPGCLGSHLLAPGGAKRANTGGGGQAGAKGAAPKGHQGGTKKGAKPAAPDLGTATRSRSQTGFFQLGGSCVSLDFIGRGPKRRNQLSYPYPRNLAPSMERAAARARMSCCVGHYRSAVV
jgi:hypothetical protein